MSVSLDPTTLPCASITRSGAWLSVTLALAFALVAAALGVWLAKGPEFAPFFAACGAVGFLLFACSRAGRGAGQLQRRLLRPFALALGRESYGIYLWHFICIYASFHVFDHAFGQANKATSLALFIVTITATLIVSYGLSRISHQLIQARASRFSRTLLARVDTYFSPR